MVVKLPARGKAAARVRERRQVAQLTRTVEKQKKQLRAARSTTRRHQRKVSSLLKKKLTAPGRIMAEEFPSDSDHSSTAGPPYPRATFPSTPRQVSSCRLSCSQGACTSEPLGTSTPATPRTCSKTLIRSCGWSPRRVPTAIRSQIILAKALTSAMKDTFSEQGDTIEKRVLRKILMSSKLARARVQKHLVDAGISRRTLQRTKKVDTNKILKRRERLAREKNVTAGVVHSFFERDDISRIMPGKKDCVNAGGEVKQTRVLNDYLYCLFNIFKAEHPNVKVGRTKFHQLLPAHIKKSSSLKNRNCLCQAHENTGQYIRALRTHLPDLPDQPKVPVSPDTFADRTTPEDMEELLGKLQVQKVKLSQWEQVVCSDQKKRTKLVEREYVAEDFKTKMRKSISLFRGHKARVTTQYEELYRLKDTLPGSHCIIQMDFAENYNCSAADQVQSAYWNPVSVTLHPVVVYFMKNGSLQHHSLCYISPCVSHNTTMITTIIKTMLSRDIKSLLDKQHIDTIHYLSDSPSSQYRNRFMFFLTLAHFEIFGLHARWDYFEAGHGKGPCDGIGGTVKRLADMATKHGHNINDARSLFCWAQSLDSSIQYSYVSQSMYDAMEPRVKGLMPKLRPLKGESMRVHAIRHDPGTAGGVLFRHTSCNCHHCTHQAKPPEACGWMKGRIYVNLVKALPDCSCNFICTCPTSNEQSGASSGHVSCIDKNL